MKTKTASKKIVTSAKSLRDLATKRNPLGGARLNEDCNK